MRPCVCGSSTLTIESSWLDNDVRVVCHGCERSGPPAVTFAEAVRLWNADRDRKAESVNYQPLFDEIHKQLDAAGLIGEHDCITMGVKNAIDKVAELREELELVAMGIHHYFGCTGDPPCVRCRLDAKTTEGES